VEWRRKCRPACRRVMSRPQPAPRQRASTHFVGTRRSDARGERMRRSDQPGRLLIYWDYDTQRGAEQSRLGPQSWGPLERPNTARILELLAEFEVRATFACVGYAAVSRDPVYDCRAQIREIHAAGHEVPSHSHEHEFLPALSPAHMRETARVSREAM